MVLVGGVVVLLALFAAGVGILAARRGERAGLVGVGAFTLVGVAASLGRGSSGPAGIVPSVLAGVVAGAVLVWLVHLARPDSADSVTPMSAMSRRRFLGTAAALTAGAVVLTGAGRWLRQRGVATAERLKTVLPRPAAPLADVPAGADLGVTGAVPFITPNADFYRIDTALSPPQVDPRDWTLTVGGRVDRPITLTYAELLARPMVEADITLSCVSNEVGGNLVGNARWLGCRLDDLLDEAGIDPSADQVVGRSVDGFTAGFPTALLDGRDALVAVGMNGEPLPIRHGFPARLVVPGVYGYVSATKWLAEIELTRFDEFEGYWIPRGWSVDGPIKTQSRIDTPVRGTEVTARRTDADRRGRMGADPWHRAGRGAGRRRRVAARRAGRGSTPTRPGDSGHSHGTRPPGQHQIRVRATDGDGETQTEERTPVAPDGATGWHTIRVSAI